MAKIIDLHFLGLEKVIASYLIETSEGPTLVETGPYSTFPQLANGLEKAGYQPEDVKHVFLTHIHLDHAGAAWAFAEKGAKIYVHPFGAKHLAAPEKLVESARRIYKDQMDRLWGDMKPIPTEMLVEVGHLEEITIGDASFKALHTPGHAVHHIAWQLGKQLFTGDVAGVKIENGPIVAPCPPPDINIGDWKTSIDLILDAGVDTLYLTHFGEVNDVKAHLEALSNIMDDWANWMRPRFENGDTYEKTLPEFEAYVAKQLKEKGVDDSMSKQYEAANPAWMSVAGLLRYWKKKLG